MYRAEQITFISTSLLKILREVVSSANTLGEGMEFFAVHGYLLQSLFLQLTGAQEQKMKCLCWEMATNDLRYRYERFYKGWSLSECSSLADKNTVYKDLLRRIHKDDPGYAPYPDDAAKLTLRDSIFSQMRGVFDGTNIVRLRDKEYETFKSIFSALDPSNFLPSNKLLLKNGDNDHPLRGGAGTEMYAIYHMLYSHRNRCAHNTPSYQLNIPRLNELNNEEYQKYNNVFLFFAELLWIDEVFRTIFLRYREVCLEY